MNYKKEETENLLGKLGIVLKPEDRDKDGKALLKVSGGIEKLERSHQQEPKILILFCRSSCVHGYQLAKLYFR